MAIWATSSFLAGAFACAAFVAGGPATADSAARAAFGGRAAGRGGGAGTQGK
jgi:hypothetical protein